MTDTMFRDYCGHCGTGGCNGQCVRQCTRCLGTGREPVRCQAKFKDEVCGYVGEAESCNKRPSSCRGLDNLHHFVGYPFLAHCSKCRGSGKKV